MPTARTASARSGIRSRSRAPATSCSSCATTPAAPTSSCTRPTPTWAAYNNYGLGQRLQRRSPQPASRRGRNQRAYKVSYNRPLMNRTVSRVNQYFNAEYALVRWLERNGYDVTYFAGLDTERRGELLKNHRLFISVGHDEYLVGRTAPQRRGGARCRRQPRLHERQRGVLEDAHGAEHRRHQARRTGRSSSTRRRIPSIPTPAKSSRRGRSIR